MNKSTISRVEKYFKIPFAEVIKTMHWGNKVSLREIAKTCGVHRQSIKYAADKLGVECRGIKDATKLTKNKGKNHFMYGKTKTTCKLAAGNSKRMKIKNPMHDKKSGIKRAISLERNQTLWPGEIQFKQILESFNVNFLTQKAIDVFNLDFFIPEIKLCIEIDSTSSWGNAWRSHTRKRDKILLEQYSIKTVRINKIKLDDDLFITNILKANDVII